MLGWTENDGPKETLAEFVVDFLKSKADMIKEHFLFTITEVSDVCVLCVGRLDVRVVLPVCTCRMERSRVYLC